MMELIVQYTDSALRDLYNKLVQQNDLGTSKEYEIFIDHFSVVPRTSDLNHFFRYKNQFRSDSQRLVVKLYKGQSRVNDSYVFETTYLLNLRQREKTQQLIDQKVQEHGEIIKLQTEIERIKKKKRKLKSRNQILEAELKQLQGNKNMIEIASKIGSLLQPHTANTDTVAEGETIATDLDSTQQPTSGIGGIETDVLLKIYSDFKGSLSGAEFQACLGIFMSVGHYKELIQPTQEFIKSKIDHMEKSKKETTPEN